MQTNNFTTIKLVASFGKFITQVEDVDIMKRIVSKVVYVGCNSSPEDFKEIDEEEGLALIKEQEEQRKLMEEANKELENINEDKEETINDNK